MNNCIKDLFITVDFLIIEQYVLLLTISVDWTLWEESMLMHLEYLRCFKHFRDQRYQARIFWAYKDLENDPMWYQKFIERINNSLGNDPVVKAIYIGTFFVVAICAWWYLTGK